MTAPIELSAPSRLHLGLLNLSDRGTRIDGGVGLMLEDPRLLIRVEQAASLQIWPDQYVNEVLFCLNRLGKSSVPLRLEIDCGIQPHVGLGWHTQLRLGIATAVCSFLGLSIDPAGLAPLLGRGGTSAIGSWGFWTGGFMVDAGHRRKVKTSFGPSSSSTVPELPPLIFKAPFTWPLVMAVAPSMEGIHGEREKALFAANTPVPWTETLEAYATVLSQMVPAIVEDDFDSFCCSMERLRTLGFKRRELAARGAAAEAAILSLETSCLRGVSMSSWGPVFFGVAPTFAGALSSADQLRASGRFETVWVSRAAQEGASLTTGDGRCSAYSYIQSLR
ncbi:MAG: beta-ribofuranosylaminobenzene 5'-phosphate synthase family protein [Actinomycetales bacterium]